MISQAVARLLAWLYSLTAAVGIPSDALAIALLTILLKVVTYPLTAQQTRAMEQIKAIQPLQKQLQEKYKSKPEEYQKRVIELYREHKVNPAAGCLPLLVQLPIFYALFAGLRAYAFHDARFLWMPHGLGLPDPYYILPILAAATTYWQSALTPTDPSQRTFTIVLPIFMGWICLRFVAGLVLYWVLTNLLAIGQQYLTLRNAKTVFGTPTGGSKKREPALPAKEDIKGGATNHDRENG